MNTTTKSKEKEGLTVLNEINLRDYFAAAALQGLLAHHNAASTQGIIHVYATEAYKFADAMLEERMKGEGK